MKTKFIVALSLAVAAPAMAQDLEEGEPVDPIETCFLLDGREFTEEEQERWDSLDCETILDEWTEELVQTLDLSDEGIGGALGALTADGGHYAELGVFGASGTRDDALCDSLPEEGRTAAQESQWTDGNCDYFGFGAIGMLSADAYDGGLVDVLVADSFGGLGTGGVGVGGGGSGIGTIGLGTGAFGDVGSAVPVVELTLDSIETSEGFESAGRDVADLALGGLDYCWYETTDLDGSFVVTLDIDEWGLASNVEVTGIEDEVVRLCVEYDFLSLWHDVATRFSLTVEASYTEPVAEDAH